MKKVVCTTVIIFLVSIYAFAESETWMTAGFQYGSYWEKVEKPEGRATTWIGSPGFVLNAYGFFNKKNIGIFIQDSFLFPHKSSSKINNIVIKDGIKDYDLRFFFQFAIGPGFRYSISQKAKLHGGVGFNISLLSASTDKIIANPLTYTANRLWVKMLGLTLGVMGDIGIKYDIIDIIYFDFGTKISIDFLGYSKISSNIAMLNMSKWNSNYIGFHLLPYIGVGVNIPF